MQYKRNTATAVLVSIVLASTLAMGVSVAAVSVNGGTQTVGVDEQTQIAVTLEGAPDGVQRYNVTVSLADSDVAEIESVSAGDIGAFQVRSQTRDSVTFRAADLSESVQAGQTNVTLGTLTIRSTAPGTSAVRYTFHDFRTDDSEQITPTVTPDAVTVHSDDDDGATQQQAVGGTPVQQADEGTPRRQADTSGSGLPVLLAAGGVAIALSVLAVLYRRRRVETADSEEP